MVVQKSQNVYCFPLREAAESRITPAPFHYESRRLLYAVDFACEVGTPVLAALDGVVSEVIDGFPEGKFDRAFLGRANIVFLDHLFGETSIYVHLREGISVRAGDLIKTGQVLGFSGLSGFTSYPHLHFQVSNTAEPDIFNSVPTRFKTSRGICVLRSPRE